MADHNLQSLYLRAISEILEGFEQYKYFAHSYLNKSDKAVQQGEKNGYDEREDRLMWLLNRQGVDTALTRALSAGNGGLSAEQLESILSRVAPQQNGQASPEFIASIVAATVTALQGQKQEAVEVQVEKPETKTAKSAKGQAARTVEQVKDDELI